MTDWISENLERTLYQIALEGHLGVIEICCSLHAIIEGSSSREMASSTRLMKFHLFNCDNTFKLDSVENMLHKMESQYDFKILVEKRYFRLQQISEMCEATIPNLQMDFAIFAVHAHESRLSINEDNAGIGYARLYRALLQATGKSTEDNCRGTEELKLVF